MDKRTFLKNAAALSSVALLPTGLLAFPDDKKLRTAHIGVGNMGGEDLRDIASHPKVVVTALCDVDAKNLAHAHELHPKAKIFKDYRVMLQEMKDEVDAVIVSTPDHTHAPASLMAMEMDKPVYCQKPLTHYVSEARAMRRKAEEKGSSPKWGFKSIPSMIIS